MLEELRVSKKKKQLLHMNWFRVKPPSTTSPSSLLKCVHTECEAILDPEWLHIKSMERLLSDANLQYRQHKLRKWCICVIWKWFKNRPQALWLFFINIQRQMEKGRNWSKEQEFHDESWVLWSVSVYIANQLKQIILALNAKTRHSWIFNLNQQYQLQ